LLRVLREKIGGYYVLVEVVTEEIRALLSTMSIENTKEKAFRPFLLLVIVYWLFYVEDN